MPEPRTATYDPTLQARITARVPLHYAEGADAALDRPLHVRAGSSLARVPGGLALVQDDAHFLAVVDPAAASARAITLPAGPDGRRQFDDGRGNRAHKLDLEACVAVPDGDDTLLVVFGSGSTARREQVVLVRGWREAADVRVVHVPRLYAALRGAAAFAGSELNVEGAIVIGERLRLFGRGNGGPRDTSDGATVRGVNATCDLPWAAVLAHLRDPERIDVPAPSDVVSYALGAIDGVALTFTDAAAWGDGVLYTAAAEDSPDAVRDGRVAGSAIGVIDGAGRARWTVLRDSDGLPFAGKVEGVAVSDDPTRLWVVVDADDAAVASELCTVALGGAWGAAAGHAADGGLRAGRSGPRR